MIAEGLPKSKKRKAPEWALEPFRGFLDHMDELNQVLHLSMRGIAMITAMPKAVAAVAKATGEEDAQDKIEQAEKLSELAQREVENGFPILHAQSLVSLWGGLEAVIRTFLVRWLANEPEAMQASQIQRLRIRLGEYESLDREERLFYVIDLLEKEIRAPFRQGVSRFECLLEIFGLSGELDETDRQTLYEMCNLRNVIVHRRGIADKRLVDACPWLGFQIGAPVVISHEAHIRYVEAISNYITELIVRVVVHFGSSRSEFQDLIQKHYELMRTEVA